MFVHRCRVFQAAQAQRCGKFGARLAPLAQPHAVAVASDDQVLVVGVEPAPAAELQQTSGAIYASNELRASYQTPISCHQRSNAVIQSLTAHYFQDRVALLACDNAGHCTLSKHMASQLGQPQAAVNDADPLEHTHYTLPVTSAGGSDAFEQGRCALK